MRKRGSPGPGPCGLRPVPPGARCGALAEDGAGQSACCLFRPRAGLSPAPGSQLSCASWHRATSARCGGKIARVLPARLAGGARDSGQVTAFVVVMMAALILLAGLILDGGLTLAARERALGEAQEAARAGAQAINLALYRDTGRLQLSPAQALADARSWLARIGAAGDASATVHTVTVTVTIIEPMQILDAAGLRAITVHATAAAAPDFGVTGNLP